MFSLLRVFAVCLLVSSIVACGGAEDRKAKYISEAQERFEAKDFDKAKLGFKNAIQIDPKDPAPRIGLAKVLVAEKNWRQAAGQYQGALQADPENNEAAIELGKLLLLARGIDEAEEQVQNVLSREPQNIDALTLKAGILVHRGKAEEAHELLAEVSKRDPSNHDTAILYATSLSNRNEKSEALEIIDEAIQSNEKVNDLLSMKALILNSMDEQDKALSVYQDLIDKNPEEFGFKQRYIAYLISIGKQDAAERKLHDFVDADAENIDARKALVDMLVVQKKTDKAAARLDEYISKFPEEYDFQMGLARLKLIEDDKASALEILNKIIKSNPEGPSAANAELEIAKIELSEGNLGQVKERLDKILSIHSTNNDALMLRGRIALQESRNTDAINDFRSILAGDPDDATVIRALAQAHFQAQEYQLAENYFKQLTHRFPRDVSSRDSLAKLYQAQNQIPKAIEQREQIDVLSPSNPANLIELAKLNIAAKQMDDLILIAEKLKSVESVAASGHYFAGLYHQSKNEHEAAVVSLDQALVLTPNAIEPLSAKVKSLLVLEKRQDAVSFLKGLVEKEINVSLANNLLGEIFIFDKKYDEARLYLQRSIDDNQSWIVPRKNLALSFRQEGKIDAAISSLKESVDEIPNASILRVELAQLFEANKNVDSAIEQYEILTQANDAPLFASNNLAMLLVTYRDDPESLQKASKVAEVLRGHDNPNYLDTLGWVYYKNAQYDLALPLIKAAADKSPANPQISYHLAKTFKAKENFIEAKKYFEKALDSERGFVGRDDAEASLKAINEQG